MPGSTNNSRNCNHACVDFTNLNLLAKIIKTKNNLIMILGNTLANEISMDKYLGRLRNISHEETHLLIGIELINNASKSTINSVINEYNCEENKELTINPINDIRSLSKAGELRIIFNEELSRIEERFVFNKHTIINNKNKNLKYNVGDYLLLSITQKPSLRAFVELIDRSGWSIQKYINIDNQYLFLLKKLEKKK